MLKNHKLWKKGNQPSEEKILAFFLAILSVTDPKWQVLRFPNNCCGSYKTISVTSNGLLKTKFLEKKAVKKRFWRSFSQIIVHDEHQRTAYKGTQSILKSNEQAIWSFLWDLRSRETFFSKKCYRPEEKDFGHFFWSYPLRQTSSNLLLGSTRFFDIYGASCSVISSTPKSLLKTQIFEEKGKVSSEKSILAYISPEIQHEKRQRTIYKGP